MTGIEIMICGAWFCVGMAFGIFFALYLHGVD